MQKLSEIGELIKMTFKYDPKMIYEFPKLKIQTCLQEDQLNQTILHILHLDQKLMKLLNVFPLQYKELEEVLPSNKLAKLAKSINLFIPSSRKDVKNDEYDWKNPIIRCL